MQSTLLCQRRGNVAARVKGKSIAIASGSLCLPSSVRAGRDHCVHNASDVVEAEASRRLGPQRKSKTQANKACDIRLGHQSHIILSLTCSQQLRTTGANSSLDPTLLPQPSLPKGASSHYKSASDALDIHTHTPCRPFANSPDKGQNQGLQCSHGC